MSVIIASGDINFLMPLLIVHSFNKFLVNTYHAQEAVLGTWATTVNRSRFTMKLSRFTK